MDICLIIDMDGVMVDRKFYVRELGFVPLTDSTQPPWSIRFRLPEDLVVTDKDRRSAEFCCAFVHGIKPHPEPGERTLAQEFLDFVVLDLWQTFKRDSKEVVAYKGGWFEKNLLKRLVIPFVNLENILCPRYDRLVLPSWDTVPHCGKHRVLCTGEIVCTRLKVNAFRRWLLSHLGGRAVASPLSDVVPISKGAFFNKLFQ